MWKEIITKHKQVTAVVFLSVVFFSSAAIGLLLNYDPQPPIKEEKLNQLLTEAKQEYYQGDYKSSIEKYQKIIANSDSIAARDNLAALYQEQGNYQLAIEHYQKLLEQTDKSEYRFSLAVAYYNTNQLSKAKEEFEKITKQDDLDKDYLFQEAYYYLALIETRADNYQLAKDYLKQSLDAKEWSLGYKKLGEIEFSQHNYQQAIKYYEKALNLDGSLKGVNKEISLAYLETEQLEQAAKYLQQAKRESATDEVVKQKIAELKPDYPQYFEADTTEPVTREDIPDEVEFKDITPLQNQGQELRIGIMTQQERIFFRVGSDFKVLVEDKVVAQGSKGELAVARMNDGAAQLKIGDKKIDFSKAVTIKATEYAPLLMHQVEYGAGYYWGGRRDMQYRGALEIRAQGQGFNAINIVPLEAYLMSVVPSEMSASWPLEALKVQSVAARSYTLANLDKHSNKSYDLCSTVHCAAYRGIDWEHPRTNQAVQETAGEIMTYNSKPINAVYSANSGGHTENSEDVWNFEVPYLKGVSTQIEHPAFPLAPAELKRWLQEIPDSYSQDQQYTKKSHYRWQREVGVEYLESSLEVEDIQQIIPTNRGVGGSVEAVLVTGAEEERKIKSGLRYKFGGLRSNRFWIQPQYENGELVSFIFYGGGWGHNVGMDQVAVASMADNGLDYQRILKHFYTDIKFENSNEKKQ
ncbi:MAG: SpoIID/LytB domain-containing protein [Bacillota bacterium]